MNKTTAVTVIVLSSALLGSACSGSGPVGFVNVDRVVAQSSAGKEFVVESSDGRLRQLRAAASSAAEAWKKAADAKEADAAKKEADARAAGDAAQAEANRLQAVGAMFEDRINVAVAKVAQERKMTIVLALPARPPYASPGSDVTDEVVSHLDEVSKLRADLAAARAAAKAPPHPQPPNKKDGSP